jgi:hypothetical protein
MTEGHSLLGASGAARWLACPGSFHLSQLTGPGEESAHAALGTAAHKLAERALHDCKDAWEYVSQKINGFDVAPNQEDTVCPNALQVYLDYVRELTEGADYTEVEHTFGKRYKPNEHFWGTADFVAVSANRLHVVDLKFGSGLYVEAVGSPQLQYYAWGAINELDFEFPDEMEAVLVIVQPRLAGVEPVREWVTTVGEIRRWAETVLLPGMERARRLPLSTWTAPSNNPGMPAPPHYVPDEELGEHYLNNGEHCRFCPALLACPRTRKAVTTVATATADTGDEALDALYVEFQTAKMVGKAIEARLMARLQEGGKFKSVKLVKKRSTRTWKDGADKLLVAAIGDDAYAKALLSPAQAEKLSEKMKAFVAENAFLPESDGYSLKPASDSTPEASPADDMARQFAHYEF